MEEERLWELYRACVSNIGFDGKSYSEFKAEAKAKHDTKPAKQVYREAADILNGFTPPKKGD